jgi:hypothetical protein
MVLRNRFQADEQKLLEPLMRFAPLRYQQTR